MDNEPSCGYNLIYNNSVTDSSAAFAEEEPSATVAVAASLLKKD